MAKKFTPPTNKSLVAAGLSPAHACDILKNRSLPSLARAVELEDKLNIPARYWVDRQKEA